METIDPNDQTNQKATNELLEKSKAIKEKVKVTMEKLEVLKEQSDHLIHDKSSQKN